MILWALQLSTQNKMVKFIGHMIVIQSLTHDSKGQPAFTFEGSDPPSLWRALTELPGPCLLFFFRAPKI